MFKWITRISAVLILCLSSVAVFAQDATAEATAEATAAPVFCGDLAQDDCALLQKSADAMKSLSSASFNFGLKVAFSDAKTAEPQTLSIEGKGSFAGLPANLMDMHTMSGMTDPAAMFSAMGDAIKNFKGDVTVAINIPPVLLEHMPSDTKVKLPDTINLELRLVDGIGYINTDTLKPLLDSMDMGSKMPKNLKGWIGIDVIQFITQMMKSNPGMMSQMSGGMMNSNTSAMMGDPAAFMSAVKIERGADKDGVATFTATLDFAKLAADPAFADMIRKQTEKQGKTVTDEELQAGLDEIAKAGDAIQFTATEMIEIETGYIQNVSLSIALDGSKLPHDMAANTSSDSESTDMTSATVNVSATVSLADFNNAPEITAPEDATIIPPAFLAQMSKGMMGSMGGMMGGSANSDATPEVTPESTPSS
ncbi:MAG: hypothetical protein ABI690_09915 [Chloroflexota bacterium]